MNGPSPLRTRGGRMSLASRYGVLAASGCAMLAICAGSAVAQSPANTAGVPADDAEQIPPREQYFSFAFQQTPWPDVLRQFAEWNELTLDLTDVPEGGFSYYDNRRHTAAEAIDILNGYLLPRGYALLRRDRFLAVLRTDNPTLANLVPTVPVDQLHQRGENELLRVVVPLGKLDAEAAAEEVAQILGPHGSVAALASSQSLVVQGFGRSLRDVVALLGQATPPATDDKLDFRAFTLVHLPALEAEQQVRQLFGLGSGTVNVSRARSEIERESYYRSRRRERGDDDRESNRPPGPVPLLAHLAMNMQVSALPHNNCLLVTATPAGLQLVEQVLASIDVPQGAAAATVAENTARVLRVYAIVDADAGEVAKTLEVIMPGVVVNEDGRHDTIHIVATPKEHAEVAALVRTLDGGGEGGRTLEVIPLTRYEPYSMALLLGRMFENEDDDERPVIQAEPRTNTLVVRGTERQVAQVRAALVAYGEAGGPGGGPRGSRYRSVDVDRTAAEPMARLVRELMTRDRNFPNPIRVVIPGEQSDEDAPSIQESSTYSPRIIPQEGDRDTAMPLRRVASLGEDTEIETASNADEASDEHVPGEVAPAPDDADTCVSADEEDSDQRDNASASAAPPQVNIEVRGDKLYLYSADAIALDQVEATIRELVQQMPERTHWTVFYLRAAEAAATSTQLYQLVSDNSPASLVGFGGLTGATGTDATTDSLQIIPDERTNALFVSGSEQQIVEIEQLLELLDSAQLPESARDRVPRAIFVQYADVNEMADMVRELYKDYLTDPAAQRRENERRENGRGNQDGDSQSNNRDERGESNGRRPRGNVPGVRLTLVVDVLTSQLIVSCDEPLYRQIARLVKERDEAARGSRRTVRMVRLGASAPANLVEILGNMSPKITTRNVDAPESTTLPSGTSSQRTGDDTPLPRDASRRN